MRRDALYAPTRPVKRASCVSQRRKAGIVASVGTVAVWPVNRTSGLAVASGCRVLPTLAALGIGYRERVRQGWPDASHPALRSGLPAATGFASRHAPGKVQDCPVSPRRFPARWRSGKPSPRHRRQRQSFGTNCRESVRQMRTLLFFGRPSRQDGGVGCKIASAVCGICAGTNLETSKTGFLYG